MIPALFDEASAGLNRLDQMCRVVQHTIQASLGEEQCNGLKLAHVLKVSRIAFFVVVLFPFYISSLMDSVLNQLLILSFI